MSIKTVDAANAPASRSYGAARSLPEFGEVVKLSRSLPAGKVIQINFTKDQLTQLGGKNPLNTFAQALRNEWRASDVAADKQRICYTVPKENAVCVKQGTPRVNRPKKDKGDKGKK